MAPITTNDRNNPLESLNKNLIIPKWIDEDYFVSILEKHEPDFKSIEHFSPMAATAPGENYTSIMIRVKIDITIKDDSHKQVSYIVKTSFEDANCGTELVNNMNLFPKEKFMYKILLPEYLKMYKAVGLDIAFSPNCLHVEETPERITLVMEDLRLKNFMIMDRFNGLDFAHTKRILIKLAELHAASAVYEALNGPFEEMFSNSFYQEFNRETFTIMARQQKTIFRENMASWNLDNFEYYIEKLPDADDAFDEGMIYAKACDDDFNVLNHGDCWTNNFLFSHDKNGIIEDCLFVDFQVGHWGSPVEDLWYLILTSTNADIRVKEFDHFIQIYHKRLVECLKMLKYPKKIPKLKELQMQFLKYSFWTSMATCTGLTIILYPSDKDVNIDALLNTGPESDAIRKRFFNNPYYIKAMTQLFPFLDRKGVFND